HLLSIMCTRTFSARQSRPFPPGCDHACDDAEDRRRLVMQHATLSRTPCALAGQHVPSLMPHASVPPTFLRLFLLASILRLGSSRMAAREGAAAVGGQG